MIEIYYGSMWNDSNKIEFSKALLRTLKPMSFIV